MIDCSDYYLFKIWTISESKGIFLNSSLTKYGILFHFNHYFAHLLTIFEDQTFFLKFIILLNHYWFLFFLFQFFNNADFRVVNYILFSRNDWFQMTFIEKFNFDPKSILQVDIVSPIIFFFNKINVIICGQKKNQPAYNIFFHSSDQL